MGDPVVEMQDEDGTVEFSIGSTGFNSTNMAACSNCRSIDTMPALSIVFSSIASAYPPKAEAAAVWGTRKKSGATDMNRRKGRVDKE